MTVKAALADPQLLLARRLAASEPRGLDLQRLLLQEDFFVALGERKIAQRIKELAFQHGVPVIENKPLARAMIKVAKVGTMIPVEMYLAVAEVLAFVMRQRERFGSKWRGTVAA